MELHDRFLYPEMKETIFGRAPEYRNKYDLAIYLRRIVILSAAFARAYYKAKHNTNENMTQRVIDKIVNRPYLSVDNAVSVLTALQSAGGDLDALGVEALRILSDETDPDYLDLYEVKAVLQDETGKFFNTVTCRAMTEKVLSCMKFITEVEIGNDGEKPYFLFRGESFDTGDLMKYEFCYLYCSLQDVDPLKTSFIPL